MDTDTKVKETTDTRLKESNKGPAQFLLQAAKNVKHTKTLIKLASGGAAGIVVLAVALPFLGTIMLFSLAVGAVAFVVTLTNAVQFVRNKTSLPIPPLNVLFAGNAEPASKEPEAKAS